MIDRVMSASRETKLEWTFRIAVAACFIGHGAFGIITKEGWLPFFGVVGIEPDTAYRLMPLVGMFDIGVGIIALVSPRRLILLHMAIWGVWTASLRPLSGQSTWELVERAGNYGVPLAFLLAVGLARSWRGWLAPARLDLQDPRTLTAIAMVLRCSTVLLLVGHGALALAGPDAVVAQHLMGIGLPSEWARFVGMVDIGLAIAVALRPTLWPLMGALTWKLATEALWPITGAPFWEFVERGGSYAAPVLLLMIQHMRDSATWNVEYATRTLTQSEVQR